MSVSPRELRIAALREDPSLSPLRRSLDVYYGAPARESAMDRLYRGLLGPGDLAFDLGSHVGDRTGSFRRCGARVVTVEPQPLCLRVLRALYGDDDGVAIVPAACGSTEGALTLHVNVTNPTVTTASRAFVDAACGASGWEQERWSETLEVHMTTLDALVAAHGAPDFVKIDVEGFEAHVLAGLSVPLPRLSFEFTTIQRDVALACLDRLAALGTYRFDVALGESQTLVFGHRRHGVTGREMREHLLALPHAANSGDVYAVLV